MEPGKPAQSRRWRISKITYDEVFAILSDVYQDFADADDWLLTNKRPLLAHYTSIEVVKKILQSEEIWMSNPLFMNDHEEMKWGFQVRREIFYEKVNKIFGSSETGTTLIQTFQNFGIISMPMKR